MTVSPTPQARTARQSALLVFHAGQAAEREWIDSGDGSARHAHERIANDPTVDKVLLEVPPAAGWGLVADQVWERRKDRIVRRPPAKGTLQVDVDPVVVASVCARYGVRRLAVFGSILTEYFDAASDVDVLIDVEPGQTMSLLRLDAFARDVGDTAFGSRQVDVTTFTAARRSVMLAHVVDDAFVVVDRTGAPAR